MADQLYLSLWFPNFRLETLPPALISVMREFAKISGTPEGKRVTAAASYPISFSEAPAYQRLYVTDDRSEENSDTEGAIIENAVRDATEQLHDDMAYEFEMKWRLWLPEGGDALDQDEDAQLDTLWKPQPQTVKILGFGPAFDEGSFEQNGHVRVDFGLDFPWVLDSDSEDEEEEPPPAPSNVVSIARGAPQTGAPQDDAAQFIQRNVESLLAFTLSVEKNCGISSRLLWTESGEPLAEKLIARLQRLH